MSPMALRTRAFARSSPNSACMALTRGTKIRAWIFACSMTGMPMLHLDPFASHFPIALEEKQHRTRRHQRHRPNQIDIEPGASQDLYAEPFVDEGADHARRCHHRQRVDAHTGERGRNRSAQLPTGSAGKA